MNEERRRVCWVVTDGRRGIENQALGLAEAVARITPLTIERRIAPLRDDWRKDLAARLRAPALADLAAPDGLQGKEGDAPGPAPDLWIGCGRASLPYSERAKAWFGDGLFVVQAQHPRRPLDAFDLVVPPRHDGLEGPNVVPILGAPNRISADWLADGRAAFDAFAAPPPAPRLAVLVGGDSKRHRLDDAALATLLSAIDAARAQGWSVLVTTSRRTPAFAVDALRTRLADAPDALLWTSDADGPNPYAAFLAAADVVLVTADSANMITEAATAGRPTLLAPMRGDDGKLTRLYEALEAHGALRRYSGAPLEAWPVTPLAETDRAAAAIVALLAERSA